MQEQQTILDVIEKLISCCEDLLGKTTEEIRKEFETIRFLCLVEKIQNYYESGSISAEYKTAMAEIRSVKASAVRVADLAAENQEKAVRKLEFELLPLLENLRMKFYYHSWCIGDEKKKKSFWEEDHKIYYRNRYLEAAKKKEEYRYDLSICVIGYNKLEYTQACVESLKRYLPEDISYELIFVNHGSTDGTKEYFESQKPDKQLDIEVNGGGIVAAYLIAEGKYRLQISNDVLVTENAIKNMYTCITSDERIGWVVPTTPNVSNLQTIESDYETPQEMYQFARANNVSDPKRWEEKPRLCNPVDMVKVETWFEVIGKEIVFLNGIAFPDDRVSFLLRREKLKLILAKDAYCYHFGSVTIGQQMGNQIQARIRYCKGRIDFIKEYGMDPWGYGMAYDIGLIREIQAAKSGGRRICGINSGIGGNPLKIKDLFKEQEKEVELTYLTQYEMNWEDVKGLGDVSYKVKDWTEAGQVLTEKYDVILLENGIRLANVVKITELRKYLTPQGNLWIRTDDTKLAEMLPSVCGVKKTIQSDSGWWLCIGQSSCENV